MKQLFLLISIILISGCSQKNEQLSPENLLSLVSDAAVGNEAANDSLSGLFPINPSPGIPSNILVDTFSVNGTKFFAVSAQFTENLNNRFAIFDENLNCYLIDKSLNGSISISAKDDRGFRYFTLEEDYFTSDSIELSRFSLYRGDTAGFNLSFRTFTMMKTQDTVFLHTLYLITPEKIRTNITAPIFSGLNNFNDDYPYDIRRNVYDVKKAIYFDEFVTDFISSITDTVNKFLKTAELEKEKEISSLFQLTNGDAPEFYLNLNENWTELRNKSGTDILKKDLTGSKFINDKQNSDIYVFKIPFYEEAENYVNADLKYEVKGNYSVRYSDDYLTSGKLNKFFEYSCKTKKYLLIISAVKDTFAFYKQEYLEIINTFYINC